MPARDLLHQAVLEALKNDGWNITHDPYRVKVGDITYMIDLAAEEVIAAEKEGEKIAIEIKSFQGNSNTYEFHNAVGQYQNYLVALKLKDPNRKLYLAISNLAYNNFFKKELIKLTIEMYNIKLIVVDTQNKIIESWKK